MIIANGNYEIYGIVLGHLNGYNSIFEYKMYLL